VGTEGPKNQDHEREGWQCANINIENASLYVFRHRWTNGPVRNILATIEIYLELPNDWTSVRATGLRGLSQQYANAAVT